MRGIAEPLGIIGGSGLYALDALVRPHEIQMQTPYGATSSPLTQGLWGGKEVIFMTRHGRNHNLAPHQINYQANVWALAEAEAKSVLLVNCVGGIHPKLLSESTLCAPDQFLDFTWGRESSFFNQGRVQHIDMTDPCDPMMRGMLLDVGNAFDIYANSCCYATTQGPRLETRAEIDYLEKAGADVVGMTAMPEVALIRERALPLAMLSVVVNAAAGRGGAILAPQMTAALAKGMQKAQALIGAMLA